MTVSTSPLCSLGDKRKRKEKQKERKEEDGENNLINTCSEEKDIKCVIRDKNKFLTVLKDILSVEGGSSNLFKGEWKESPKDTPLEVAVKI